MAVIPPTAHRLWYGPRLMPDLYARFGKKWAKVNDHSVVDHLNYRPTILGELFDGCGSTWEPNPGGGKVNNVTAVQRADIASYELLYEHGGVYLNCDIEARRPIAELIDGLDLFLVMEDQHFVSNAVMGATAGHPFLRHVIDLIPDRIARMPGRPMNEQTGPHLLTEALATWHEPVAVFPPWAFMGARCGERPGADEYPDAYAVHHWGHAIPDEELWTT